MTIWGLSYLMKTHPLTPQNQLITSGEQRDIAALQGDRLNAAVVSVFVSIYYWYMCLVG